MELRQGNGLESMEEDNEEYYYIPDDSHRITIDRNGNVIFPPTFTDEDKRLWLKDLEDFWKKARQTTQPNNQAHLIG